MFKFSIAKAGNAFINKNERRRAKFAYFDGGSEE